MGVDPGTIRPVNLEHEMERAYIDYAMSVIVARALPDARDGLKPVQRRILYDMHDNGHSPDKPYVKSARVVGDVMGHYHPHGDAAIYDAMVKLAQSFNTRYPLVDGHGNFGSIDGDPPAAPRYTEVRQARVALELLRDIEKKTVEFGPNFDQEEEPLLLPARFPNLLVNGSTGIAVGMATNIPPHNLREVAAAVDRVLEDPNVDLDELMAIVQGPDFPTGALIVGREAIEQAYRTGRGAIVMRAVATIDTEGNHPRIVITELPYQVNKAKLVERIADLARDRRVEGITDLRDESDRDGMRIVVELRRDANPRAVLRRLYRYTPMQDTFGVILLALVDNRPRLLSLKDALVVYADHQRAVVRRRTEYDLAQAEARAHILEGLLIALANLDDVIALIRASADAEAARTGLMERFGLSEEQARAILDLRLQRLTALEREKVEAEHRELVGTIADLKAILADEGRVREIVRRELREVAERYGDDRRTRIVDVRLEEDDDVEMDEVQDVVVTFTHFGYVKRQPVATYRTQRRGGRGITGARAREEDFIEQLFVTTTHHSLLVFTDRGRTFRVGVHRLPEAGRGARGTAIVNLVELAGGEKVTAVIPVPPGELPEDVDLLFVTRRGRVKRTALAEYANVRRNGLIAIGLEDGDSLVGVHHTRDQDDVLLATRRGQLVRFVASEVRRMGRTARGVMGVRLRPRDEVVASAAGVTGGEVLTITEAGLGKRTAVSEYRRTARGAQGVRLIGLRGDDAVAGILVLSEAQDIMLISTDGVLIRTPSAEVAQQGRGAHGVRVMRLGATDRVSAIAAVPEDDGAGEGDGGDD